MTTKQKSFNTAHQSIGKTNNTQLLFYDNSGISSIKKKLASKSVT